MTTRRTLIVGDVHGCLEELQDLLEQSGWTENDELIFVGDLVAKGPKSLEVVRLARELGARAVRGNHDQHCLRWWEAKRAGKALPELRPAHQAVADRLEESDWRWLATLPYWLELPEHQVLVVHAGLRPNAPVDKQDPADLMNMRSIRADGSASSVYQDGTPWAQLWKGPAHVVFGHDAIRGLQQHPYATGLDTGCVYGGRLTGLWLPSRDLVSVPARAIWTRPGKV
jgi:hypothetical protein